jgi:hypothetical protein
MMTCILRALGVWFAALLGVCAALAVARAVAFGEDVDCQGTYTALLTRDQHARLHLELRIRELDAHLARSSDWSTEVASIEVEAAALTDERLYEIRLDQGAALLWRVQAGDVDPPAGAWEKTGNGIRLEFSQGDELIASCWANMLILRPSSLPPWDLVFVRQNSRGRSVLGVWESARATTGGAVDILEFRAGGRLLRQPAIRADTEFSIAADSIKMDPSLILPLSDLGASTWLVNTPRVVRKIRVAGERVPRSPVGVWTWLDQERRCYEVFREDGTYTMLILVPPAASEEYELHGDQVLIRGSDGGWTHRWTSSEESLRDATAGHLPGWKRSTVLIGL